MLAFLYIKSWCEENEIPKDVVNYLFFHFYVPFEQAEREEELIDRVVEVRDLLPEVIDWRQDHLYLSFHTALKNLLENPSILLDARAGQERIHEYIDLIESYFAQPAHLPLDISDIPNKCFIHVLEKGLIIDSMKAFGILDMINMGKESKETVLFLKRMITTLDAMPDWFDSVYKFDVLTIARYCVANEIYEPVWRWISIWPHKVLHSSDPFLENEFTPSHDLQLLKAIYKEPYVPSEEDVSKWRERKYRFNLELYEWLEKKDFLLDNTREQ